MLIVFGDDFRRSRVAIATYTIAFACAAAAFVTEAGARPDTGAAFIRIFAFVPLDFSLHPAASAYTLVTPNSFTPGLPI